MINRRVIGTILLWLVAGIFVWAGILKVLDPDRFVSSILSYGVFSRMQSVWIAIYLPFVEIIGAICLASGFWRSGAVLLFQMLLVAFIVLIAQAALRGLDFDCGCFGGGAVGSTGWQDIALLLLRDVALIGAIWIGARFAKKPELSFR